MPYQAGDVLLVDLEQRVIKQIGRSRPETVAEVRNHVINFFRDW